MIQPRGACAAGSPRVHCGWVHSRIKARPAGARQEDSLPGHHPQQGARGRPATTQSINQSITFEAHGEPAEVSWDWTGGGVRNGWLGRMQQQCAVLCCLSLCMICALHHFALSHPPPPPPATCDAPFRAWYSACFLAQLVHERQFHHIPDRPRFVENYQIAGGWGGRGIGAGQMTA